MRFSVVKEIQKEDPSYDPIPFACERSGISEPLFRFCGNYIYADGYYGPYSVEDMFDEESAEGRGLAPAEIQLCDTRDKCLAVLRSVAEEIGDYVDIQYALDENDNEVEVEEPRVDSSDIVNDLFHYVREIYGSSILSL
jgi:hypothetical protein